MKPPPQPNVKSAAARTRKRFSKAKSTRLRITYSSAVFSNRECSPNDWQCLRYWISCARIWLKGLMTDCKSQFERGMNQSTAPSGRCTAPETMHGFFPQAYSGEARA
jgi:hypothetical protein